MMFPKRVGYPDHMVFSEFRRRFDVLAPHLTKKHGRNYIVKDEKRVSQSHREECACQAESDAAEEQDEEAASLHLPLICQQPNGQRNKASFIRAVRMISSTQPDQH